MGKVPPPHPLHPDPTLRAGRLYGLMLLEPDGYTYNGF